MKSKKIIQEIFSISLALLFLTTCKKFPQEERVVYTNDFEQTDLKGISGGVLAVFNGSKMLGRYNNSGFNLSLDNLPKHDLIKITFDLYIQDSWDGNSKGDGKVIAGPDLWQMKLDGDTYINTTFSNTICNGVYCLMQSYPHNYPYNNEPKTGVLQGDLPGVCHFSGIPGGTSLYRIERIISHKKNTLFLEFQDMLKQSNVTNPLCDESWSMDNLIITTSVLK